LLARKEACDLEYNSKCDKAKEKIKVKANLFAFMWFILSVSAFYYFFKFIPADIICGVAVFLGVRASIYGKVLEQIKPSEELEKVSKEISVIKNRYVNENFDVQTKLDNLEKGLNGEVTVSALIEKELTDKFILLNDIVIPASTGTTQIDHVLVTPMRIICIETKSSEGIYYPNKAGWMWYPTKRQKYGRTATGVLQPNPANQALYHANSMVRYLTENNLQYKVEAIVVLSNMYSEYKGDNRYCDIIAIDKLISYLRLDCTESSVINSNEANLISELLIRCNGKITSEHYDKFSMGK
jgi:hypothetical protein